MFTWCVLCVTCYCELLLAPFADMWRKMIWEGSKCLHKFTNFSVITHHISWRTKIRRTLCSFFVSLYKTNNARWCRRSKWTICVLQKVSVRLQCIEFSIGITCTTLLLFAILTHVCIHYSCPALQLICKYFVWYFRHFCIVSFAIITITKIEWSIIIKNTLLVNSIFCLRAVGLRGVVHVIKRLITLCTNWSWLNIK